MRAITEPSPGRPATLLAALPGFRARACPRSHCHRALGRALLLATAFPLLPMSWARGQTGPCQGPDANPWVVALHERVVAFDGLARWAIDRYGAPLTCEGSVTTKSDEKAFGVLRLGFAEGVTFTTETQPPETSVVMLRASGEFDDEDAMRQLLQVYADGLGLHVDWDAPTVADEGDERVRSFHDPQPGVNGTASLIYRGDVLVGLRLSMAL